MADDNERSLFFFEASSMRELYESLQTWANANRKHLRSFNIQVDCGKFYCIARV